MPPQPTFLKMNESVRYRSQPTIVSHFTTGKLTLEITLAFYFSHFGAKEQQGLWHRDDWLDV
ncbi:hypothetical protein LB505_004318 [Fusarium chuoi]|nr:hypothetical protein LB505_004318 [Fusarium chuoi]